MNAQIIYDMPEEQYHAETGLDEGMYVTRSMVNAYINCKSGFKLQYIDRHPLMVFNGNAGTSFGSFFEAHLLDNDISKYVKKPSMCYSKSKGTFVDWNLRGGQYVIEGGQPTPQTTKEWEAENTELYCDEDMQLANFAKQRFSETALGKWWIDKVPESKKQVTVRWTDEYTGLNMQIRIDNYLPDCFLCDLKSTAKSIDRFSDVADSYGYHVQAAMYSDAMEIATGEQLPFLFAIFETTNLKRAGIRQLHPMQVQFARSEYKKAMQGIANGDYSANGYDAVEAQQCELPAWLLYKYESE